MTDTYTFDTDAEARAFIEGVQVLNADAGAVVAFDLEARGGRWAVVLHRTDADGGA